MTEGMSTLRNLQDRRTALLELVLSDRLDIKAFLELWDKLKEAIDVHPGLPDGYEIREFDGGEYGVYYHDEFLISMESRYDAIDWAIEDDEQYQ